MTPDTPARPAGGRSVAESPANPQDAARELEAAPGYVDLGAMILGGEDVSVAPRLVERDEHTEPAEAFGSVLSRFRARLARSLPPEDSRSHQDMGIAYRAMGLGTEAIGEFQRAIRKDPSSAGAREMLGRCFLDAGQPELAADALEKALELPRRSEDELLGIYYFMGRAQEASGNPEAAFGFYRKTLAVNIDFRDVAARFRDLGQTLADASRTPEDGAGGKGGAGSDSPGPGQRLSGSGS